MRIRMPMLMRMTPPVTRIAFPNRIPKRSPTRKSRMERIIVTMPIIRIGCKISTSSIAKLTPTAEASVLVAKESMCKVISSRGFTIALSELRPMPEISKRMPKYTSKPKATQWSYAWRYRAIKTACQLAKHW